MLIVAACGGDSDTDTATGPTTSSLSTTTTAAAAAARSGALPMGDGKYTTSPQKGAVFSCQTRFGGGGGAFRDGPWIDAAAKTWDPTKKIAVRGSVEHKSTFVTRDEHLTGNGLPTTPTGVFPVAADDPAYQYDRNPNRIAPYTLDVTLPRDPRPAASPSCVGGTIGVSLHGVPIYSAFDALGRDAAAHEVQDACDGHPERTGQYHFHSLSSCFTAGDRLFGYALDGFGIYVEPGVRTADLDECHGRTSEITWRGARVSMYHYVATDDFPYLVGCYRGTPIARATGLNIGPPGGGPGMYPSIAGSQRFWASKWLPDNQFLAQTGTGAS